MKWKILAVPFVAFLCGLAVCRITMPKTSNDLWAYSYLCFGKNTDDITTTKAYAEAAHTCASDPRLNNFADKKILECDMFLKAGVKKITEVGSWSGLSKAAQYGISSPLNAIYESVRTWNLDEEAKQIDSIYAPQLRDFNTKKDNALFLGGLVFWVGLITGWVWLFLAWKRARVQNYV